MALIDVAPGDLATVVTWLEMRARPLPRPMPASSFRLLRWTSPSPDRYRALFQRVGSGWLWFSRLVPDDDALARILSADGLEIHVVVDRAGIELGLLELDFSEAGACNLSFFGLVPELTGKGHGRWLMAQALALGWRKGVERLWLHTCSLDHPSALGFYRQQGFVPYRRALETFPDPRLIGLLPPEAAPQIPLLGAAS